MGFNKRNITKESIKIHAKSSTYESFKEYMMNSDAYIFHDKYSTKIWDSFTKANEKKRKKIYSKINKKSSKNEQD